MTETRGEKFNSGEYLGHSEGKTFNTGNLTIPIAKIRTNPFQPRKVFDKAHLAELAESIKEHGVIEPIVVRTVNDLSSEHSFELVAGERRLRASAIAGKTDIPVIVREYDDKTSKLLALIENIQREDLNFMDTMNAYADLKKEYNSTDEVARHVKKDKRTIERYLRCHAEINSLPEFAELCLNQSASISLAAGDAFARIIPNIRKLQKSNNREFGNIIKRLGEKGIKESLPWLEKKFTGKRDDSSTTPKPVIFTKTTTEFSLNIKPLKNIELDESAHKQINEAMDLFLINLNKIIGCQE